MHLIQSHSQSPSFAQYIHAAALPTTAQTLAAQMQREDDLETGHRRGYIEGWYWGFGCGACLGGLLTALLIIAGGKGLI